MTNILCYKNDSKCPKCNDPNASAVYIHGGENHPDLILRICQSCGFGRKELPLDNPDCK